MAELIGVATINKDGLMSNKLVPSKKEDIHALKGIKICKCFGRNCVFLLVFSHPYKQSYVYLITCSFTGSATNLQKIVLKDSNNIVLYYKVEDVGVFAYIKFNGDMSDVVLIPLNDIEPIMKECEIPEDATEF